MSANNYRLTVQPDPIVKFDADTCMPYMTTNFELKLLFDAQHDGRLWNECEIWNYEQDVIEDILNEFREKLVPLVHNTKIFGVHGPK